MAVVAPICVASSIGICVVCACVRRVIHWWWLAQFNFQQVCNFQQTFDFQQVYNFQQGSTLSKCSTFRIPTLALPVPACVVIPRMLCSHLCPVSLRGWGPALPCARVECYGGVGRPAGGWLSLAVASWRWAVAYGFLLSTAWIGGVIWTLVQFGH